MTSAFPADAVFQWRVVNNEQAKKFLGSNPGGPRHQSETKGAYICVYSRHVPNGLAAHLSFYSDKRQVDVAPDDYIVRTESGRFVPVDREVYERLTS